MGEGDDGRGRGGGLIIPPWMKLSIAVVGTTGTIILAAMIWISNSFVSRVEYSNHSMQQAVDFNRLVETQHAYALKEASTAEALVELKVDTAEIKGDVGWMRNYLDISKPPPRKNGKKP